MNDNSEKLMLDLFSVDNEKRKRWLYGCIAILLGLLLILIHNHQLQGITSWFSHNVIHQHNQAFLTHLKKMANSDFQRLATLSSILEVARSSQIGISFIADLNIDIGDILSAFTQLVEKATELTLASVTVIMLLQLIANVAEIISPWLLQLSLFAVMLMFVYRIFFPLRNMPIFLIKGSFLLFTLFLVFHLIYPYSLHISSAISHQLTSELRQHNSESLKYVHDHIVGEEHKKDLKENAEYSVKQLRKISASHIHHKIETLSRYITVHLAIMLFDLIVMPLLLLYLLYRVFVILIKTIIPGWAGVT